MIVRWSQHCLVMKFGPFWMLTNPWQGLATKAAEAAWTTPRANGSPRARLCRPDSSSRLTQRVTQHHRRATWCPTRRGQGGAATCWESSYSFSFVGGLRQGTTHYPPVGNSIVGDYSHLSPQIKRVGSIFAKVWKHTSIHRHMPLIGFVFDCWCWHHHHHRHRRRHRRHHWPFAPREFSGSCHGSLVRSWDLWWLPQVREVSRLLCFVAKWCRSDLTFWAGPNLGRLTEHKGQFQPCSSATTTTTSTTTTSTSTSNNNNSNNNNSNSTVFFACEATKTLKFAVFFFLKAFENWSCWMSVSIFKPGPRELCDHHRHRRNQNWRRPQGVCEEDKDSPPQICWKGC